MSHWHDKLNLTFVQLFQYPVDFLRCLVQLFYLIFMLIVEESTPEVSIIVLISFWKNHLIKHRGLQIQLQLLKLFVQNSPHLIFNLSIILIAFNHLFECLPYDIIKYFFQLLLLLFWILSVICLLLDNRRYWIFYHFLYRLVRI